MKTKRKLHKKAPSRNLKSSDYGIVGLIRENNGLFELAKDFHRRFIRNFPKERDPHFFFHIYTYRTNGFVGRLRFYRDLFRYSDINPNHTNRIDLHLHIIGNPDVNRTVERFKENFSRLLEDLRRFDSEISSRLSLLNKLECLRLNEAMKCLKQQCNLATIVMSVSAVEHRLHKLLEGTNRTLYRKEFSKVALGGIIELFRKNSRYQDPKYRRLKVYWPQFQVSRF